jgi:hypothetical protein
MPMEYSSVFYKILPTQRNYYTSKKYNEKTKKKKNNEMYTEYVKIIHVHIIHILIACSTFKY